MRSVHMKIGIIDFRRLRVVEMPLKSALHRSKALIFELFKQPLRGREGVHPMHVFGSHE